MSENVKNFIDKLASGNNTEAGEAFKAALRDKVADSLDNARKDLASNMFKAPTEAEDFSDPKPEIADPGVFNADGSISATPTNADKKDGKAELDLTPEADNADKQDS